LRKILWATSYAQKPCSPYAMNFVWLTLRFSRRKLEYPRNPRTTFLGKEPLPGGCLE
jgi:hypothetical protein